MLDGSFSADHHLTRCKIQEEFAKRDLQSHKAILAGSRAGSTRFDALRLSPQAAPELAGSLTSFDLMGSISPSERGQRVKSPQGPHSFQRLPYERHSIAPGPWHSYHILKSYMAFLVEVYKVGRGSLQVSDLANYLEFSYPGVTGSEIVQLLTHIVDDRSSLVLNESNRFYVIGKKRVIIWPNRLV